MAKKYIYAVLFCLLTFLTLNAETALACSCGAKPTVLEAYEYSELVVITKAISLQKVKVDNDSKTPSTERVISTKLVVEKAYKGQVEIGDEITLIQGGGADCIWTFDQDDIGKKYLFYLGSSKKDKQLAKADLKKGGLVHFAITCGRSRGLEYVGDDKLYLDKLDKVKGKTRISGTIKSLSGTSPNFANRKLQIIGKEKIYQTKTNKDGVYEIYDLPAGVYSVEPELIAGWKVDDFMLEYSKSYIGKDKLSKSNQFPIILEDKKHASLDLFYEIDNAIRGRVLSPEGKPMQGVCINAISNDLKDIGYKADCTDSDGKYEIDEIPPGSYILVVNDDGKISSREPFGTLYYPGVPDRKDAVDISIDVGNFLNNLDIQIPQTAELVEISGKFLYSDGQPVIDESIVFEPDKNTDGFEAKANASSNSKGEFTIKILRGSVGKLYGSMYSYVGEFDNCPILDNLIKSNRKKNIFDIVTPYIEITADKNMNNLVLKYPFPGCKKSKDDDDDNDDQ